MKSIGLRTAPGIGLAGMMFLLSGCDPAPTLQLVRLPLISPVVIPDVNIGQFLVTAAVYNWGDQPTQPGKLGLAVTFHDPPTYWWVLYGGEDDYLFDFPALGPGQGWTPIKDVLIAEPSKVGWLEGSPNRPFVACFKNECNGWIELTLFDQAGIRIQGQNTKLKVTWDLTGNLALMQVSELP